MKCTLCSKNFRDTFPYEVSFKDASECFCGFLIEEDFEDSYEIPYDIRQDIDMIVRMNDGKRYFQGDFED